MACGDEPLGSKELDVPADKLDHFGFLFVVSDQGDHDVVPVTLVSSADVAEPLSDLSDDFVDLERLQKGRFLFQLRTPFH